VAKKRNPRVDRAVQEAVAELLETEVADPRLAFVTITEAEVTQDHEVATIYYSTLDPALITRDHRRTGGDRVPDEHEVVEGFVSAAPRLRAMVGRRARLRTSPELRFKPDPVVEQATRVEQLLRDLGPGDVAAAAEELPAGQGPGTADPGHDRDER
jgi:ribosome-binding factor A